jgi:hypothetical protein
MRSTSLATVVATLALALGACTSNQTLGDGHGDWRKYGGNTDAHALPQVAIGALGGDAGQIKAEGTITDVCAIKGCWMRLRGDDGAEVLVRFKEYGFFVPRNATGRRAWVTGTAERVELSVEALRHLAEDARKSPAEIAAITKPSIEVTFTADTVWIDGAGLQDPYRPIGQEQCDPVDSGTTPIKH